MLWMALDDHVWDLSGAGFGWVDPFMVLSMVWPCCVLFLNGVRFTLRRKSATCLTNDGKVTMKYFDPVAVSNEQRFPNEKKQIKLVCDKLSHLRAGISKPSLRAHSDIIYVVHPKNSHAKIGGYRIVLSDMKRFSGTQHSDLGPHILDELIRRPDFKFGKSEILAGEHADPMWAIWESIETGEDGETIKGRWVIKKEIDAATFPAGEESYNRQYADKIIQVSRLKRLLAKYGKPDYERGGKNDRG